MSGPTVRTIEWIGDADGHARLVDQTLLPGRFAALEIRDVVAMRDAIRRLAVRGAPAIGVAAALGVVLGMQGAEGLRQDCERRFEETYALLAAARPTAVNLVWALDRMRGVLQRHPGAAGERLRALLHAEAVALLEEDRAICRRLGEVGAALVRDGDRLLTHCNAGALATAGIGTALAVMYVAREQGKRLSVYADETRPLLQGARLTAWELQSAGIDVTLICDNTAAHVMRTRGVDRIFVGADRIAANGDAANKIGTYGLAIVAKEHGVPFYVVAPTSTFDLRTPNGNAIPIEERSAEEVTSGFGTRTAPEGVAVFSPAFDVTPARLLTGIVTERGLISPVDETTVRAVVG